MLTPEKRLIWAMLERAILDYVAGKQAVEDQCGSWSRNARKFFLNRSRECWSFLWACEVLDIAPSRITKYLRYGTRRDAVRTRSHEMSRYFDDLEEFPRKRA